MTSNGFLAYDNYYETVSKKEIKRLISNDNKLKTLTEYCYTLIKRHRNMEIVYECPKITINTKQLNKFDKIIYYLNRLSTGYHNYQIKIYDKEENLTVLYDGREKYEYVIKVISFDEIYLIKNDVSNIMPLSNPRFHKSTLYPSLKSPIFEPQVLRIIQKLVGPRRLKVIFH